MRMIKAYAYKMNPCVYRSSRVHPLRTRAADLWVTQVYDSPALT